jgi:transcriptional regulator
MSPGRFEAMTRAIIGARLTVDRLEGVDKLSQNKGAADRAGVVAALGEHRLIALGAHDPAEPAGDW